MPIKERHFVAFLGDNIVDGTPTTEVDLSSANWAYLYARSVDGTANTFEVQSSPQPFGTTPTWYRYGKKMSVNVADTDFAVAIPPGSYGDYCTPRRVRVVVSSGELDKVYIEGIREIS